ncbi:MAG: alanine dehydrogenase, partial [Aestuariivirgaceae bacterium]
MLVGIPKEIKVREYRVGLTPTNVREIAAHGHQIIVQSGAGEGIGMADNDYVKAGAKIVADAAEVFRQAEMIVKVKEPQASEIAMLQPGQILFTYLHLAPDPEQTSGLIK